MKIKFILLLVLLLSFSCEKSDEKVEPIDENPLNLILGEEEIGEFGEIIYQDHTLVLNQTTKNFLLAVEPNFLVFNYSESFNLIQVGDVIFSNETNLAPDGFARRVVAIEKNDGYFKFTTAQANSADVFKKVNYQQDLQIDFDNIINLNGEDNYNSKTSRPALTMVEHNVNNERIDVELTYDLDRNLTTKKDQLKLAGFVEISHIINPLLIYNYDVLNSNNNVLSITGLTDLTIGGEITYGGKRFVDFVEDDFTNANTNTPLAFQQTFDLFSLPLTAFFTPSNIIVRPELVFFAHIGIDINGKVSLEFSKNFRYNYNYSYHGSTTGNGWDNSLEEVLDDSWGFEFGASAEIECEITPFTFGTILSFPQFIASTNRPPFVGIFVYPWTQKTTASVEYNTTSNCFETSIVQQNKWKATLEAEIATIFNANQTIDVDLTLYSAPYTTDSTVNVPDFCFTSPMVTLTTNAVTTITETSAQCGGNITNDGGNTITARGVCWSTSQIPTVSDQITNNGTGTGNFNSSLSNLNANTTYYVRAYATNSQGTTYGNEEG